MKIFAISIFSALFISLLLMGCSPSYPTGDLCGTWRYEAPIAQQGVFGNSVVTEQIQLKLTKDGKVVLNWNQGDNAVAFVEGSIKGDWKQMGDMLVMTNPDSSFGVFRIVGIDKGELRILTRQGKLYKLSRMPD